MALWGLFLFTTPLASAQSDATNSSSTTVPADTAPTPPPASPSVQPQILPPTLNPAPGNPQGQDEIDDIRPPLFYLHSWTWLWLALAAIALVALLVYLWQWLKPNRLLSARSAFDLTLEKLNQARELLKEEDPMPYAIFVSETIRAYLGQRFLTPSTRRTTDEFLRVMESDPHTPLAEHRDLLRHFLEACDLVKFAKYRPTLAELEDVQNRAVTFVTATKPVAPSTQRKGAS